MRRGAILFILPADNVASDKLTLVYIDMKPFI